MDRLIGKVALISGGARGMGAADARAIVAEGGKVVVGDILDQEGAALVEELGTAARYVHLDVTSSEDWAAAVAVALSEFGRLNVLVNNAGIANFGPLGSYTKQQWDTIIAINLTGQFLGIDATREALIASAPSSIVNISSTNGFIGGAAAHGYTAAKFGVRGLTKSVAVELAAQNVRANSVHPGVIKTPMTAGLDFDGLTGPMGRAGEPEEVAALVVFLASDESSYSTGSEFITDGGDLAGKGPVKPL